MSTLSTLLLLLACNSGAPPAADAPTAVASASAAPAAQAAPASSDLAEGHVVARWKGGSLSYGDVQKEISTQLVQMEVEYLQNRYQTQLQASEALGMRAVVQLEAQSRGITEDQLVKLEIEDKLKEPTDKEVEDFYPVVKRQLRNAPLDQVKDQVKAALMERQSGELLQSFVTALRTKYEFQVDVPFPDLPRIAMSTDDDPSQGPENAKVTVIEFGDYQCGYCAKAFSTVQELRAQYPNDVRIVYRDFPLSFHPRAMPAAVAANCAGVQGRYWEMHNLLMQNQGALEDKDLRSHAEALKLNMDSWQTCMNDSTAQVTEIQKDFTDGEAAGVSGTPAFFINGIFLSGALPLDQFKSIIEREIKG